MFSNYLGDPWSASLASPAQPISHPVFQCFNASFIGRNTGSIDDDRRPPWCPQSRVLIWADHRHTFRLLGRFFIANYRLCRRCVFWSRCQHT